MNFDSSDDDMDDDFVPDSLLDFVKNADAALSAQVGMFMDELSPRNDNGEEDAEELDDSHVHNTSDIMQDLQANMERIALVDKKENKTARIDTSGYDSEDFASPSIALNPASNLTYTELQRAALDSTTPTSDLLYGEGDEEKKSSLSCASSTDIEVESARSVQAKIEELGVQKDAAASNTLLPSPGQGSEPTAADNNGPTSSELPNAVVQTEAAAAPKEPVAAMPKAAPSMGFLSRMFSNDAHQQKEQEQQKSPTPPPVPEQKQEAQSVMEIKTVAPETKPTLDIPKAAESVAAAASDVIKKNGGENEGINGPPEPISCLSTQQGNGPPKVEVPAKSASPMPVPFQFGKPEPSKPQPPSQPAPKPNPPVSAAPVTQPAPPKAPMVETTISNGNQKSPTKSMLPSMFSNGNTNTNANHEQKSATAKAVSMLATSFSFGGTKGIQQAVEKTDGAFSTGGVKGIQHQPFSEKVVEAFGNPPQLNLKAATAASKPDPDAMDVEMSPPSQPSPPNIVPSTRPRGNAGIHVPAAAKASPKSKQRPAPPTPSSFGSSRLTSPPPQSIQVPTKAFKVSTTTSSTAAAKSFVSSSSPANRTRAAPPTSRLLQPTAAFRASSASKPTGSRARVASTISPSKSLQRSPKPMIARASPATSTGTGTTTHSPKRLYTTPTQARNRFMQPTASKTAHVVSTVTKTTTTPQTTSSKKREGPTIPHVSSRLMKSTASSKARVSPPTQQLPQKRIGAEEAVARARERVRQRKMQEARLFGTTGAQFSVGAKPTEKPKPVRERKTTPLGNNNISPRFATPTSSTKAHQRTSNMSMAQSGSFFGKGLRGGMSPTITAPRTKPALTKPVAPNFSTTLRRKRTVEDNDRKTSLPLAQSSTLLASTLRAPVKTPVSRHQAPPKFHTSHKRTLPKSATELEQEKMNEFLSNPFRAGQKPTQALHTGSSAGLSRVSKRGLTKPEPFKLSSGSKTVRKKEVDEKPSPARPLASTSANAFRASPEKKRTVTTPQPFSFAVDLKSKTGSSTKTKRTSPGGFKARPLPKTTFRGPTIEVHQLASTPPSAKKQQQRGSSIPVPLTFRARPYHGPPTPTGSHQFNQSTTPQPFQLESAQRQEAFQQLMQEKSSSPSK